MSVTALAVDSALRSAVTGSTDTGAADNVDADGGCGDAAVASGAGMPSRFAPRRPLSSFDTAGAADGAGGAVAVDDDDDVEVEAGAVCEDAAA